jgi:uncharacterized membrane protein YfcA
MDVSLHGIFFLVAAALVAGVIDAIAGGGGLVTLPALLAVGLPPHVALGTNKGQSVFGPLAAILRFRRAGMLDLERARVSFPAGLAGALGGSALVLLVQPAVLRPLVVVLLVGAAAFVTLRPASSARPRQDGVAPDRRRRALIAAAVALGIGAYDGFFGPGTGTFLIVAFVALLGDELRHASAAAKVVNFASNLASVAIFSLHGVILWRVALPMAVAQAAGGFLGAHLTVRGGDKVVRRVVLLVVVALVAKIIRDILVA